MDRKWLMLIGMALIPLLTLHLFLRSYFSSRREGEQPDTTGEHRSEKGKRVAGVIVVLLGAFLAANNWVLGTIVIALGVVVMASGKGAGPGNARQCPHCAQWITRAAKVCPVCRRDVEPA